MEKFRSVVGLCLLFSCVLPAQSNYCFVNLKNNLNGRQPLLLHQNLTEFEYPKKSTGIRFLKQIRVACPQDNLSVSRTDLAVSEASAKCRYFNIFELLGTGSTAQFKKIYCASTPKAEAINTNATCPNGTIAQIGFRLQSSSFVPSIEQICHNETLGQTHWVHSRVVAMAKYRQKELGAPIYEIGPFYQNMTINSTIFTKISQRARLQTLLNDSALVDKIIAPNGTDYLVEGMLAPRSDMYYRAQQNSTFFYINTVPMWKSIRDGNWKLVEKFVRLKALVMPGNLDVWTGGIDVMPINGTGANATLFTLTTDRDGNGTIPVPRFLFKYVVDTVNKRGLVFITLNDPRPRAITAEEILCNARNKCTKLYPSFDNVALGYTYCCTVDKDSKFASIARNLGLPIFDKALPLFSVLIGNVLGK